MAWACEAEMACKKHQNRNHHPGVCPTCLRERLSKLPGAVSSPPSAASSASCSPRAADYYNYSSGSSSGRVSPRGHRRITSDVVGHFSLIFSVAGGGALKKSRSIALVAKGGGAGRSHGGGKKKEGFWSKLIRSTGKKTRRVFLL